MIKRHSYLFLVVLVLAMLSFLVACDNKSTPPPHEHTFADKLIHNETHHWYPATCEHTDEVKDKAEHTWDDGKVTTPAGYGVEGEKTYTCTACGRTRTESIDPIPPMTTGSIKFVDGYTLDKTYSNEPISIEKSKVVRVVDGIETPIDNPDAISFLFKQFDAGTYIGEAPKKTGHYMVKVIVAASPEWTEKEFEQGFYITAKELTFATPPTKVFDGSNTIINVEKENLVGIANSENISVEIDTKKSDVIDPTQTPTGYSYVIKDNGNITKNYTITDNELHKARIVAKKVDFLPSYTLEVIYNKGEQCKLGCESLFGEELRGYDFIVKYKDVNAGAAYDSHFFEKNGKTSYNYKLTSDAERIVKEPTIKKSKLKLTQTSYSIYVQNSSDNFCYFVLQHINESSNPYRAIKCTYNTPLYSTVDLTNATFEPDNNHEVVVPNNAKLIISDTINGSNEINIGNTKDFTAESGKYTCDVKLNGVEKGSKYSILVTCDPSRNYQKTVFSVDSTGTTVQLLPKTDQTQRDSFIATGSGTYYLRISNIESDVTCTVNIKKVE